MVGLHLCAVDVVEGLQQPKILGQGLNPLSGACEVKHKICDALRQRRIQLRWIDFRYRSMKGTLLIAPCQCLMPSTCMRAAATSSQCTSPCHHSRHAHQHKGCRFSRGASIDALVQRQDLGASQSAQKPHNLCRPNGRRSVFDRPGREGGVLQEGAPSNPSDKHEHLQNEPHENAP